MPRTFLSSLIFALLATVSVGASAATPAAAKIEGSMSAPMMHDKPMMQDKMMHENMMGKVNINTADADTLQKELSGIGKSKAAAIVAYREANGTFTSVDELIEVKGIGKSLLDKNRDKLAVE